MRGQTMTNAQNTDLEAVKQLQLELKDAYKGLDKFKQQNQDYFQDMTKFSIHRWLKLAVKACSSKS